MSLKLLKRQALKTGQRSMAVADVVHHKNFAPIKNPRYTVFLYSIDHEHVSASGLRLHSRPSAPEIG